MRPHVAFDLNMSTKLTPPPSRNAQNPACLHALNVDQSVLNVVAPSSGKTRIAGMDVQRHPIDRAALRRRLE